MYPEQQAAPETAKPLLELRAGDDFWDSEDIHSKVISKLADLDMLKDGLLLCGYDGSVDISDRTTTFALTLEETTRNIDIPTSSSVVPYEYAIDALKNDGIPEVAVYDPEKFVEGEEDDMYELKAGYTLEDAIILRLRIL